MAQAFGLEIGFVNQAWTHGRFVTGSLQTAAMAVVAGMAKVVACANVLSFTRERDILGGPHDFEGYRESGGTHAETPHYGLTAPADIPREPIQGLHTYDAFSPLVLFVLERFGFCAPGEAAAFVQEGRIGPGGALPVSTSGGLLSEAHVADWNSLCEMMRQLRGDAGPRQIADARALQWATGAIL